MQDKLEALFEAAANKIKANIDAAGLTATGRSADSVRCEFSENTYAILGRKFFATLERGRAPGKRPPLEPILEWVKAKPLEPKVGKRQSLEAAFKSLAFAVSLKIAKKGTNQYIAGQRNDIYTEVLEGLKNDVKSEIVSYQNYKITNELNKLLKQIQNGN